MLRSCFALKLYSEKNNPTRLNPQKILFRSIMPFHTPGAHPQTPHLSNLRTYLGEYSPKYDVQVLVVAIPCVFKSHYPHQCSQMAITRHLRAFFIIVEYVNMIYIYDATTTLLRQNAKINLHNHQSNFRLFAALALSQSRRQLNHFQLSEQ